MGEDLLRCEDGGSVGGVGLEMSWPIRLTSSMIWLTSPRIVPRLADSMIFFKVIMSLKIPLS